VKQQRFPHSKQKRKTAQTKKANKPKDQSVVCSFYRTTPTQREKAFKNKK
jgi:hypothetical protein